MQRNTYGAPRRTSSGAPQRYPQTSTQRRAQSAPQRNMPPQPRQRIQAQPPRRKARSVGPWPVWKLVLVDVIALGLALLVFALFHHVLPRKEAAVGAVSSRSAAPAVQEVVPASAPTAVPDTSAAQMAAATAVPAPTAQPDPVGYFGTKFADKFTAGDVIKTDTTYQSANVNVTMNKMRELDSDIYVVDIYVKDISCLRTEFAQDTFARGTYEWPASIGQRLGAIVTMSGDYYGGRSDGVVIRNGVLYRDSDVLDRDVGVLYWDGSMKCFSPSDFDSKTEMANGAYQAWNFGPMLLDANGNAMTEFNSKVNPNNPRAAFGYYEPGHYCMVVVDGRSDASKGLSLKNLSAMMAYLGCKQAYNLDGGATAALARGGELVSKPSGGGRKCSDFIMVFDRILSTT